VAALFSSMDGYLALETKKDFFKRMLNVLLSTAASSSVVHVKMFQTFTRTRLFSHAEMSDSLSFEWFN